MGLKDIYKALTIGALYTALAAATFATPAYAEGGTVRPEGLDDVLKNVMRVENFYPERGLYIGEIKVEFQPDICGTTEEATQRTSVHIILYDRDTLARSPAELGPNDRLELIVSAPSPSIMISDKGVDGLNPDDKGDYGMHLCPNPENPDKPIKIEGDTNMYQKIYQKLITALQKAFNNLSGVDK